MKVQSVKIICSSPNCQFNDGEGYNNLCQHESAKNVVPYGGIDRYYVSKCELYKPKEVNRNET